MESSFNVSEALLFIRSNINGFCSGREPWELIATTFFTTIFIIYFNKFIWDFFEDGGSRVIWKSLRKLPFIKQAVAKQMKSTTDVIEKELQKGLEGRKFLEQLPKESWSSEAILEEVGKYLSFGKFSWDDGYVSGTVYPASDESRENLLHQVYKLTAYTNPLHPDVFPGVRVMEAEIVRMVSRMFNAPEPIGTVTTGGTESIFLVCKAYRDFARWEKGIKNPNMVVPVTAHAAFEKAAHMLKIKVKKVKYDPDTMAVNVTSMKRAIDSNTCMIVGSAPQFPHGCMDNIEEVAKLAYRYSVPMHVDACLGGFLIPFMRKAGFPLPPFDFTLNGVTSISADTHKYAYAPKGTSVILYKHAVHRHYQYSIQTDWPGGIYGTPNLSGSRSGGTIATCWASLLYHGEQTYVECTRKIISTTRLIEKGLRDIDGIVVFGQPAVSVIAVGSRVFDIYRLSSALSERGWNLNVLQFPSGFHMCVTMQHTREGVAERFLRDVTQCTAAILGDPVSRTTGTVSQGAAIYGMAQQIPDRSLVSELVWSYLDACYTVKNSPALESSDAR